MSANVIPLPNPASKPQSRAQLAKQLAHVKRRAAECVAMSSETTAARAVMVVLLACHWKANTAPDVILGKQAPVPIYPGRQNLAFRAGCSEATVKRALDAWRERGCIRAVQYAKGGRNATRYVVQIKAIMMLANRQHTE